MVVGMSALSSRALAISASKRVENSRAFTQFDMALPPPICPCELFRPLRRTTYGLRFQEREAMRRQGRSVVFGSIHPAPQTIAGGTLDRLEDQLRHNRGALFLSR